MPICYYFYILKTFLRFFKIQKVVTFTFFAVFYTFSQTMFSTECKRYNQYSVFQQRKQPRLDVLSTAVVLTSDVTFKSAAASAKFWRPLNSHISSTAIASSRLTCILLSILYAALVLPDYIIFRHLHHPCHC